MELLGHVTLNTPVFVGNNSPAGIHTGGSCPTITVVAFKQHAIVVLSIVSSGKSAGFHMNYSSAAVKGRKQMAVLENVKLKFVLVKHATERCKSPISLFAFDPKHPITDYQQFNTTTLLTHIYPTFESQPQPVSSSGSKVTESQSQSLPLM